MGTETGSMTSKELDIVRPNYRSPDICGTCEHFIRGPERCTLGGFAESDQVCDSYSAYLTPNLRSAECCGNCVSISKSAYCRKGDQATSVTDVCDAFTKRKNVK